MCKSGISVTEKPCTFASLLQAEEILLTNAVSGIRWIRQLDGTLKTGSTARLLTGLVNRELSL
jgi:branched-subunit amino acid aminotransferase/4-amino-4-deoxychorismate lyase